MKSISQMSMAARLTLGFGVILAMMLGMATLSLVRMQALTSALEVITVTNAERAQTINAMKRQLAAYVKPWATWAVPTWKAGLPCSSAFAPHKATT